MNVEFQIKPNYRMEPVLIIISKRKDGDIYFLIFFGVVVGINEPLYHDMVRNISPPDLLRC